MAVDTASSTVSLIARLLVDDPHQPPATWYERTVRSSQSVSEPVEIERVLAQDRAQRRAQRVWRRLLGRSEEIRADPCNRDAHHTPNSGDNWRTARVLSQALGAHTRFGAPLGQ